ncbi:MAG: ATP-binding cassette domain-containing protein [Planctomycetes bacterium]|jgi:phospholipid/cholesterol/gamma-HCH transport system ATP-binding protein|nr:ATP-binding cassette domain-containing protein [Planctomycetota bacterium]
MDSDPPTILEVRDLSVGYGGTAIVRGVDFAMGEGEIFVIMGPSGCGKTTVLKTILGLIPPVRGDVAFRGRSIRDPEGLSLFRRSSGMVFQQGALLNSASIEENVSLPLTEHTVFPPGIVRETVRMKLAQVGLLAFAGRRPGEISGGMRKRAGIARALAIEPELLLFDEPTGGLDPITADGIDNLILRLRDELGMSMLVVTHELASVFKIADRILMLRDGQVAALGDRDDLRRSGDEGVRGFVNRQAGSEAGAADGFLAEVEGGGA